MPFPFRSRLFGICAVDLLLTYGKDACTGDASLTSQSRHRTAEPHGATLDSSTYVAFSFINGTSSLEMFSKPDMLVFPSLEIFRSEYCHVSRSAPTPLELEH